MKRLVFFGIIVLIVIAGVVLWQHRRQDSGSRTPHSASRTPDPASRIPHSASRLNVVLITIDTLRADRVGRGLTPSIDRLAARGAAFTNVRATAPLTLPSHVSLMTGTIPPVHGVRENGMIFDRKTPTLARILKEAGYRTAAFVGAYVLNRRFGLDEGFETYDDTVKRDVARAEQLEAERPGAEVVDAALAWLQPPPSALQPATPGIQPSTFSVRPFFLWVHLYDPHAPYQPPREFLDRARGQAYDGEVAYADAQVGRLLDALDAGGLTDSTIVAVTGDHGEGLGEHGEQTHGMLVYDATLRVPVIIAAPGFQRASDRPCHWELASGLLRMAGLSDRIPQGMASGPLMRTAGSAGAISSGCVTYSESLYPRRAGWHALAATADAQWKLIVSSEHELFDLRSDPGETRNVAAGHPSVMQAMAATLSKAQPRNEAPAAVAPEAAERLRALGYVGGSRGTVSNDPQAPNPARVIAAWTAFEQALGSMQAGRPNEAARALKRLTGDHPGSPVFLSTYAQALKDAGDPLAAVAIYRAAVAKWPTDPSLFHDLAAAARDAGHRDEAARAEHAALALDSGSAMAQNGLGLLEADAGRSQAAAAAFEKAARLDPGNASYWTNLGNARRAMTDTTGAEHAYRRALEADAEFADALNGLGTMVVQAGRATEAVPLFERALRRDPHLHEARLNLGIALQESGERDRAAAAYREVLATAPPSAVREREAAAALLKGLR